MNTNFLPALNEYKVRTGVLTDLPHRDLTQILHQVIAGDARAFESIYELYHGKIFAFACKLTKSAHTAKDVTQTVFMRIWEKRDGIQPDNNFEGYVMCIARNMVLNIMRDTAREQSRRKLLFNQIENLRNLPEDSLVEKELSKVYNEAITLLAPQKKRIYLLRKEVGLTYDSIGKHLHISPLTAKKHMTEAVRFVRTHVQSHSYFAYLLLLFCLVFSL